MLGYTIEDRERTKNPEPLRNSFLLTQACCLELSHACGCDSPEEFLEVARGAAEEHLVEGREVIQEPFEEIPRICSRAGWGLFRTFRGASQWGFLRSY